MKRETQELLTGLAAVAVVLWLLTSATKSVTAAATPPPSTP